MPVLFKPSSKDVEYFKNDKMAWKHKFIIRDAFTEVIFHDSNYIVFTNNYLIDEDTET